MKCNNCGYECGSEATFCENCGNVIETNYLTCKVCGETLTSNTKFCINCGTKVENVEQIVSESEKEIVSPEEKSDETVKDTIEKQVNDDVDENKELKPDIPEKIAEKKDEDLVNENSPKTEIKKPISTAQEVKKDIPKIPADKKIQSSSVSTLDDKIMKIWSDMDLFCKILIFSSILVLILFFVSVIRINIFALLFSIVQCTGLIIAFLIHKDIIKCKKLIGYITLVSTLLVTIFNVSSYSWNAKLAQNRARRAFTPCSAEECIGKKSNEVINDFNNCGFTNISKDIIADLEIDDLNKKGIVEVISINGISNFSGNQKFDSSSKVLITYHTIKASPVPISSNDALYMEAEEIKKMLKEAGFINVSISDVYDLDSFETDDEFQNKVHINDISSFNEDDMFPLDSKIEIVTHRIFEQYLLNVSVDFIGNLIFSKYAVVLDINGKTHQLAHGQDGTFEYRLRPGKYTVKFYNAEDSSIKGTKEIEITDDTDATFKIYCHSEYIDVDTVSFKTKEVVTTTETTTSTTTTTTTASSEEQTENAEGETTTEAVKETEPPKEPAKPQYTVNDLIHLDAQKDASLIKEIANSFKGKTIDLRMITAYVEHNGSYKTRFNYLLYAVEGDNVLLSGPAFLIENVNYNDLHLTGSNIPDSFGVGLVCKVKAKIDGTKDGMVLIKPTSIEVLQ